MIFQSRQWPILDFDPSPEALLNPTHENLSLQVPRQFFMAFVGKQVPLYACSHHARRLVICSCVSKKFTSIKLMANIDLSAFAQRQ